MGSSSYSLDARQERSTRLSYTTADVNTIFTQQVERKAHADMMPTGVTVRECRDSAAHPSAIPIQLYLDVTGSMWQIPHEMVKTGLQHLMGTMIQNGVPDAALMFGAIGDHEADRYPLQVGQFESGDAELDMWLTRTYLEGNGGGNAGESYLLAWYFATYHVATDAWDKRKQKGYVFTIGDEPCLKNLPISALKTIMGPTATGQGSFSVAQLLEEAQKTNHVYHIFVEHGGRHCDPAWSEMLGDHLVVVKDHTTIPKVISDIIISGQGTSLVPPTTQPSTAAQPPADLPML